MKNEIAPFRPPVPPLSPETGDIAPEAMRRGLDLVVNHILQNFARDRRSAVLGRWTPGQLADRSGDLPIAGMDVGDLMNRFETGIAPGFLRWNNPSFFAYFNSCTPTPALMAEILVAAYNSNRMTNDGNPASAEIDDLAGRWLGQFLNIPAGFEAQFYVSASISFLHALNAARSHATAGVSDELGVFGGPPHRIYTSENAHFFVRKIAAGAGVGRSNVVLIPADASGGMSVAKLREAIKADVRAGHRPLMVVATVGTTSTTAVDDVPAIGALCRKHRTYFYIDAAHAGAFAAVPAEEWIRAGWDQADAICINPHKQLMCPLGSSALFVRNREEIKEVCYQTGEYISANEHILGDPQDYTLMCGQRQNSLPLLFNFLAFGADALRANLQEHLRLGRCFAARIENDPLFELAAPAPLSTICFRVRAVGLTPEQADEITVAVWKDINASGEVFIGKTVLKDGGRPRPALRVTIGNINTTQADVLALYAKIRSCAAAHSASARRRSIPGWSYWARQTAA